MGEVNTETKQLLVQATPNEVTRGQVVKVTDLIASQLRLRFSAKKINLVEPSGNNTSHNLVI